VSFGTLNEFHIQGVRRNGRNFGHFYKNVLHKLSENGNILEWKNQLEVFIAGFHSYFSLLV
jgi:hypothetical protein